MTSFRKYFRYRLTASVFSTVVFAVLASVFMGLYEAMLISGIIADAAEKIKEHDPSLYLQSSGGGLILIFALAAMCVPIAETYMFKNRRTLDFLLSLPVSRTSAALAHYLNGLLRVLFIGLCPSVVVFVIQAVSVLPYPLHILLGFIADSAFLAVCLYSVTIFLFSQGNSLLDGIMSSVFTFLGVIMLFEAIMSYLLSFKFLITDASEFEISYWSGIPNIFGLIITQVNRYGRAVSLFGSDSKGELSENLVKISRYEITATFWLIAAVAAAIGFVLWFGNYRSEKAGGISNSPLSYKLFIPLCGASTLYMVSHDGGSGIIAIFVAMVVGYFVYRRSFKLLPSDVLVLIFSMLVYAMSKTEVFV